jgi:hypothetical protein
MGVSSWYFRHVCIMLYSDYPLCYLLFLYCPAPLLLNNLQCLMLYYLHTPMHYVSILFIVYHSLFLSYLPQISSDRPTNTITFLPFSLSFLLFFFLSIICRYVYSYLIGLVSIYKGKTYDLFSSEPGLYCLT